MFTAATAFYSVYFDPHNLAVSAFVAVAFAVVAAINAATE